MPYVRVTKTVIVANLRAHMTRFRAGERLLVTQKQADALLGKQACVLLATRGDGPKSAAELDAIEAAARANS